METMKTRIRNGGNRVVSTAIDGIGSYSYSVVSCSVTSLVHESGGTEIGVSIAKFDAVSKSSISCRGHVAVGSTRINEHPTITGAIIVRSNASFSSGNVCVRAMK